MTQKMGKLPPIISQEEFEKLFSYAGELEKKSKSQKQKIRKFRIAMLLGFEAGLRISEIVGYKGISKIKNKTTGEVVTTDIEILPLSPDMVEASCIRLKNAKGRKDRVTARPKRLNANALNMLPLKMPRRALQRFINIISTAAIGKKIHFHCVDKKTEILTPEGWKNYSQLQKGNPIFTYNLDKNLIEKKDIKEVFSKVYSGEMYHIKNKYINSLITPNHKIVSKHSVKKGKKDIWNKWNLSSIENILKIKSLRQLKYKLSSLFQESKPFSLGVAKASILGWILSDGCISCRGKRKEITIQQSLSANKEKCEIISELLGDCNINYSIKIQKEKLNDYSKKQSQMVVFRIFKNSIDWIFNYINNDRTPKLNSILKLNPRELQGIYENMMLGDGTNRFTEYCGQNKKRIELIRILACLLGKRTLMGKKSHNNKTYHRTYITEKDTCDIHRDIKKTNYKGIVWCPSTTNGTFIARREGTIFLTGNTLRHGFATHYYNKTKDILGLQQLMGHSRTDTTSIYSHINPVETVARVRDVFE